MSDKVNPETTAIDGNDTTPEDLVQVEVDGQQVDVQIVDGVPQVEIPDGMEADKQVEYLSKIGNELSHTLSKYKSARTEQNEKEQKLSNWEEELKQQKSEIDGLKKKLSKPSNQIADNVNFDYEDEFNRTLCEKLDCDKDELEDIMVDEPTRYMKAMNQANLVANKKLVAQSIAQSATKSQQTLANQMKIDRLSNLARQEEISPEEVVKYAESLRISHLPEDTILNFYKSQHSRPQLKKKVNYLENLKTTVPKPIIKGSQTFGSKNIKNMTPEEIEALPMDDPRLVAYMRERGLD